MQDERAGSPVSPAAVVPHDGSNVLLNEDQRRTAQLAAAAGEGKQAPSGSAPRSDEEDGSAAEAHVSGETSPPGLSASSNSSPATSAPPGEHGPPGSTALAAAKPPVETQYPKPSSADKPNAAGVSSEAANEAPLAVGNPYRRRSSRHAKPKGILKPPPPPQAKFSFRRDVLGYVVGESVPLSPHNTPNMGSHLSSGVQSHNPANSPNSSFSAANPAHGYDTGAGASSTSAAQSQTTPNAGLFQHKPAAGLWRRLGGAVTAVAGSVPVPQTAVKTLNSISAAVRPSAGLDTPHPSTSATQASPAGYPQPHQALQASPPDSLKAEYVKSVRFTMSSLSVVYPINGPGPPGIEAETRKRINKEHLAQQELREKNGGWTTLDLLDLYEECCRTREEPGIAQLRTMLMSTSSLPKVIDLRDVQLTHGSAAVLSDLLSIDFGLRKLILDNCGLDDESIKMIIHALLVSGTLPSLSLANNRKIRIKGWKIISYFVRRSAHLKYLDLSDNIIDKKTADLLGEAVSLSNASPAVTAPEAVETCTSGSKDSETSDQDEVDPFENRRAPLLLPKNGSHSGLSSLRLENCALRNPVLESLANCVRCSGIKHISLRRNRINQMGAVALAVLIRDYELTASETVGLNAFKHVQARATAENGVASTASMPTSSPSASAIGFHRNALESPDYTLHNAAIRARASVHDDSAASTDLSDIYSPSSASSISVSETEEHETSFGPDRNQGRVTVSAREASRYAEMRTRLQKQIEVLPRVGTLLTLDIRSNDIKGGITYISQVLKRNRTLRVLNFSDNKIEPTGLVALSEALKYNTTLETLDLSNNPCCGPSLEGIRALRTALVLNESLMRVFLNATGFESTGAIALAEYLPDMQSVIHMDLTDNPDLSIAGVMALAASVKHNRTIRCLDLSIPPNNAEFARLSQDILQACVRNTEQAQEKSAAKGSKGGIATPIFKSELARDLKGYEKQSSLASAVQLPKDLQPLADSARHCIDAFSTAIPRDEELRRLGEPVTSKYTLQGLRDQAVAVQLQMSETSKSLPPGPERQALEAWTAHLAILLQRATNLYRFESQPATPLRLLTADSENPALLSPHSPIRSPASPSRQLSSPSFSITDSDGSESESSVEDSPDVSATSRSTKDGDMFSSVAHQTSNTSPVRTPRPLSLDLPRNALSSSPRSPVENHSRILTLEEGEVFRRGISKVADDDERTLLDVLDGKEDIAGEELKQEILETEVERPRRLSISTEEIVDSKTMSRE